MLLEKISPSNAQSLKIISSSVLDLCFSFLTLPPVQEADGVYLQVFINTKLKMISERPSKILLNKSTIKSNLANLLPLILTLILISSQISSRELFHGSSIQTLTAITSNLSNKITPTIFLMSDTSKSSLLELISSLEASTMVLLQSSRSVIATNLMIIKMAVVLDYENDSRINYLMKFDSFN